ncbi:MAG: Regulation of nuclear pre-mRNA domain containing protein 1B [Chrysothrix sp. TS-e1954]|nr:MAG: Regulation of nuclear pre-mRNA domain containing protein 1B [Chrysothrix sp. TS-e1954]
MSYTDDAVRAKLSALNETQESIVSVAQWVLFHWRYADRTAQLWFQRLRDSGAPKRLNLVYLANEVVQQSKTRRKDDFHSAFSPIIAEALKVAYKATSPEVQSKLRRVVEVWRARHIFDLPIQETIESQIDELDKERSSNRKPMLGGPLFSNNAAPAPPELEHITIRQVALSKASLSVSSSLSSANTEYEKILGSGQVSASLPVRAAQLSGLLRSLASAENLVNESLKARNTLVEGLQELLEQNRTKAEQERDQIDDVRKRKEKVEQDKNGVEDAIMQGLSSVNVQGTVQEEDIEGPSLLEEDGDHSQWQEPSRPDVEPLTPPPQESTTPPFDPLEPQLPSVVQSASPEPLISQKADSADAFLNSRPLTADPRRAKTRLHYDSSTAKNGIAPNIKRRKTSHDEEFGGFGNANALEGLDDEVVGMLG